MTQIGQRLSIVIPTLNEAEHIRDLLNDLAPLRAEGHEVILVDASSQDETTRLAAPFVDTQLQSRAGRARQMNVGAQAASGDILWFLHADCRVPASAGTAIRQAIQAGKAWGRFDVRLSGERAVFRLIGGAMNLRSCLTGVATGDQGMFVERGLFHRLGGFAEIPLMEDIALSKRLLRHGRPACVHQPMLVTSSRRWEQHGILRTIVLMWRLRLRYFLGTPADRLARHYR